MAHNDPQDQELLREIRNCCGVLEDKQAEDLKVLHLGDLSSVADYYVIATGTSRPHLRALAKALEKSMAGQPGVVKPRIDADAESGWVVFDAYDFMVHLFLPETRRHYGLESLWKDAPEYSPPQLMIA